MNRDRLLSHSGVKGMKWGVRAENRAEQRAYTSQFKKNALGGGEVPVLTLAKPGKAIQTYGGHNAPATMEARASKAAQQKAKVSGLASLTNAELATAVNRMGLEKKYKALNSKGPSFGRNMTKELLTTIPATAVNIASGEISKTALVSNAAVRMGLIMAPILAAVLTRSAIKAL